MIQVNKSELPTWIWTESIYVSVQSNFRFKYIQSRVFQLTYTCFPDFLYISYKICSIHTIFNWLMFLFLVTLDFFYPKGTKHCETQVTKAKHFVLSFDFGLGLYVILCMTKCKRHQIWCGTFFLFIQSYFSLVFDQKQHTWLIWIMFLCAAQSHIIIEWKHFRLSI